MAPQKACHGRFIVTLVAFVLVFSFVRCQMSPQIACPSGCKVTLAASYVFFFHVSFSNVSLNCIPVRIRLIFLHCALSNVSSNRLCAWIKSHIGCNYLIFLHCAFSHLSSNCWHERMHSHIGCTFLIFLLRGVFKQLLKLPALENA